MVVSGSIVQANLNGKVKLMNVSAPLSVIFLIVIAWPQTAVTQTSAKPEDLAQKSAESWLAFTDSGKYAESWQEAAASFKSTLTQDQWVSMVKPVRAPLGKVLSRKLRTATYRKDPPNTPPGEYVIIQYDTSFESKKDAVETVVPTLDKDAKWRVSGYFIK